MFKWKKLGKIFDPSEVHNRPWIYEYAQAPTTLIFDDVVRIYFACRPPPDASGNYVSLSAYAEFRRNNLTELVRVCEKPMLELGQLGSFDEFGTYFTSVIRKKNDVLAYYVGYTRCQSVPFTIGIGAAISHDGGDSFTRIGSGPVLPCSVDEPFFLTVPRIREFNGQLYLWYSAGRRWLQTEKRAEPVYQIRMATSSDGVNWEKINRNLIEYKIALYTETTGKDSKIIVLNVMGLLAKTYFYADVAYIGGGFNGGIHNCLEAAVYNVPVTFYGEEYIKFNEAVDLIELGAAINVKNNDELLIAFNNFLKDEKIRDGISKKINNFFESNLNITDKILSSIKF